MPNFILRWFSVRRVFPGFGSQSLQVPRTAGVFSRCLSTPLSFRGSSHTAGFVYGYLVRDGHLVCGETNWNIDRQVFMAVQKAFDTLTDMTKRRAYDSSLEFDDSIPGK